MGGNDDSSNWNNARNAGLFLWNLNNATSNSNANIRSHLRFMNSLSLTELSPCHLAKQRNKNPVLVANAVQSKAQVK